MTAEAMSRCGKESCLRWEPNGTYYSGQVAQLRERTNYLKRRELREKRVSVKKGLIRAS